MMRKYVEVYKATLMEELQYAKGFLLNFIGTLIHIFIFFALWKYLYSSGDKSIINGYTLVQMIWYVTFTEFLTSFSSSNILRKTPTNDIVSGNIAYALNKPYDYTGYIFARFFAESTIKGIVNLICSIILGLILIGPIKTFDIRFLPFMIISIILAIIVAALIRLIISYLSFWVENSEPFQWLFKTIFLIFGVTFPLEMFPMYIRPIIRYSPVYAALSGPVKMIINFNINEYLGVILSQLFYIVLLIIILKFEYKEGARKLNVNGG